MILQFWILTAWLAMQPQQSPAPPSAAPLASHRVEAPTPVLRRSPVPSPAVPRTSHRVEKPTPASKPTAAPTAAEVVAKIQLFYQKTQQLSAKFRQTYTNTVIDKRSVSDGRLWIKKPGKIRWDYKGKRIRVKKSFVSDGTWLWIVEHDNKQVFKKNVKDDLLPVAVTFLYGKGDLSRDFDSELVSSRKYGAKQDIAVKLTPRKPTARYKNLLLVVDSGNFRVKQSIVQESSGNVNHFRFYEPNTKRPVKDSYFVFKQKAFSHYRIIEPEVAQPR